MKGARARDRVVHHSFVSRWSPKKSNKANNCGRGEGASHDHEEVTTNRTERASTPEEVTELRARETDECCCAIVERLGIVEIGGGRPPPRLLLLPEQMSPVRGGMALLHT